MIDELIQWATNINWIQQYKINHIFEIKTVQCE